jgi:hypothetical protein
VCMGVLNCELCFSMGWLLNYKSGMFSRGEVLTGCVQKCHSSVHRSTGHGICINNMGRVLAFVPLNEF